MAGVSVRCVWGQGRGVTGTERKSLKNNLSYHCINNDSFMMVMLDHMEITECDRYFQNPSLENVCILTIYTI
jgi:hypothetical protein